MLAGLLKGPNYFNPDRHPERAKERLAYVLGRMQEDGVITADAEKPRAGSAAEARRLRAAAARQRLPFRRFSQPRGEDLTASTSLTAELLHGALDHQRRHCSAAAEAALQEGLARYEIDIRAACSSTGRKPTSADAMQKLRVPAPKPRAASALPSRPGSRRCEARACRSTTCIGTPAVILDKGAASAAAALRVGLGRRPRRAARRPANAAIRRSLKLYDVVYVRVDREPKGKAPDARRRSCACGRACKGAALVLENKTGRILAMAGGFSYPLSQLNRTSQTQRQPGSAIKPLTYLTALQARACSPTRWCSTSRSRCRRSAA